jgi:hypothetical protein
MSGWRRGASCWVSRRQASAAASGPEHDSDKAKADGPKPLACRDCGADMMCTGETPRPTVPELMAMPPSMGIAAYGGGWPLPVTLVGFT